MRSTITYIMMLLSFIILFNISQVQAAPIKVPQVWMDDEGKIIAMAVDEDNANNDNGMDEKREDDQINQHIDQEFIDYLKSSIHDYEEEFDNDIEDTMYLSDPNEVTTTTTTTTITTITSNVKTRLVKLFSKMVVFTLNE
ncbi:hypothetical protein BJ944DRAFT_31694 [Cunninghamella echinulata]|nr:hypothetical protein BJ944DRAFT_31694 [Cunninghamella echinulata]